MAWHNIIHKNVLVYTIVYTTVVSMPLSTLLREVVRETQNVILITLKWKFLSKIPPNTYLLMFEKHIDVALIA